jgi:hypothetical protein
LPLDRLDEGVPIPAKTAEAAEFAGVGVSADALQD